MRRLTLLGATAALAISLATTGSTTGAGPGRTAVPSATAASGGQPTADLSSSVDPSACFRPLPERSGAVPPNLPWPVVLTTGCGRFVVSLKGLVTRAPADTGQTADPGYRVPAGADSWVGVEGGHVVFVNGGKRVWRSAGAAFDAQNLGTAVHGDGWLAFSIYAANDPSPLYMTKGGEPEHVLGHNEDPLVATRWGGFMTSRWRADGSYPDLLSRRGDGSLVSIVARRVTSIFPERRGTVLYERARKLWRTDGMHLTLLADLSLLGRSKYVNVEPLQDGRILVSGTSRIAILRSNGRTESAAALAPIPKGGWGFIGIHTVEPGGKALVVTATRWNDESMGGGPGWEGVYVLRPGAQEAHLLFGRKLNIAVCAHSATLSWHERWLLYSACEGRVVAIDTTGRHAPLFLSRLARLVPEPDEERQYGLYGAEWAAFGPAPSARPAISLR
jgi:hypothetical protein